MKTPYDIVLLVGKDEAPRSIPAAKRALEKSGLSYLIIGDGERLLTTEEVEFALKGNITNDTQCHIWAHGWVENGTHTLGLIEGKEKSGDVFQIISDCAVIDPSKPNMVIHAWACNIGEAKDETKTLDGISLLLHGASNHETPIKLGTIDTIEHIEYYTHLKTTENRAPTPEEAIIYSATHSPETVTLAEKKKEPITFQFPISPLPKSTLKSFLPKMVEKAGLSPPEIKQESLQLYQDKVCAVALFRGTPLKFIKKLLEFGANVNTPFLDTNSGTALHIIHGEEHTKFLLENGADINKPDYNGNLPLHMAALTGRTDELKAMLPYTNIESKLPDGRNPLHVACAAGEMETARFLIENGANINAVDRKGNTPLNLANGLGMTETAALLLENGADVNKANYQGTLPLHMAALGGNTDVVKVILPYTSIDSKLPDGQTALHIACAAGKTDTVRFLIENGADITAIDNYGNTPLTVALNSGEQKTAETLLSTGLLTACSKDRTDLIQGLLKNGADINTVDKDGNTPLNLASKFGRTDTVQFLLELGADVNKPNYNGTPPLHSAASHGRTNTVKALLEHKDINIESKLPNGKTALHMACAWEQQNIVDYMVENGASALEIIRFMINSTDIKPNIYSEEIPLHITCANEYTSTARVLIESGANMFAMDNHGKNPLDLAFECGKEKREKTFLNIGLLTACSNDQTELAQTLLQEGADINAVNREGNTSLNLARKFGHAETTKLLLENGAGVNESNYAGIPPLHMATSYGYTSTAEALLPYADIEEKLPNGKTALHVACASGKTETVRFLIENGADMSAVDNYGSTPFLIARKNAHGAMAEQIDSQINELEKRLISPNAGRLLPPTPQEGYHAQKLQASRALKSTGINLDSFEQKGSGVVKDFSKEEHEALDQKIKEREEKYGKVNLKKEAKRDAEQQAQSREVRNEGVTPNLLQEQIAKMQMQGAVKEVVELEKAAQGLKQSAKIEESMASGLEGSGQSFVKKYAPNGGGEDKKGAVERLDQKGEKEGGIEI